jgi:hypothetical protein
MPKLSAFQRERRRQVSRTWREHRRTTGNIAHDLAEKYSVNVGPIAGTFAGHYGALYWSFCGYFASNGQPLSAEDIAGHNWGEAYARARWECEVTVGYRPFRPMHKRLIGWALKIAKREHKAALRAWRKRERMAEKAAKRRARLAV